MNTSELSIIHVSKDENWELARAIREEVFVVEQQCPPEEEWDQYDVCSRHLVALSNGESIATGRWRSTIYEGMSVAKLERVAVLKQYREKDIGRLIVDALIADSRAAGFDCFIVHAQSYLIAFYESIGFSKVGDAFEESGSPHQLMVSIACKK